MAADPYAATCGWRALRTTMNPAAEISVSLDREASAKELDGVRAAFASLGLPDISVEANYFRKSFETSDLPWVVFISLGTVTVYQFVSLLTKDGYESAKRWIQRVWEARRDTKGSIVVDGDLLIVLQDDLPAAAWEQLGEMDLDELGGSHIQWDAKSGSWRVR